MQADASHALDRAPAAPAAERTRTILFVDDEPALLSGLECLLRKQRNEWRMTFAAGGPAALELLETQTYDVVVTDLHMPGCGGVDLLERVKTRAPNAVRIILSGTTGKDSLLRSASGAHQFLSKPCDPETLKAVIRRAFVLRERLADERLLHLASGLAALPSLPELYLEIQELARAPQASIEDVGRIVARDVSMSAKVLHLANSAFFGARRSFASPVEATVYLGLDTISALALTSPVFERRSSLSSETIRSLWAHSLRTAALARAILVAEGRPAKEADQAFVAGLLHEAGLLVLAAEMPERLAEAWQHARRFGLPLAEGERRRVGATRAAVGAYLMGIWNLPDPVVEAIAFQSSPAELQHEEVTPLTAVHVASALAGASGVGPLAGHGSTLDLAYLRRLGLAERIPSWQEHCRQLEAG